MTNCKHGNGQDCQQCQYERDAERVKDTGHEAWELWEYMALFNGVWEKCIKCPEFNLVFVEYRRRPDADQIIKGWKLILLLLIEQLCVDLNSAHDELCKLQGIEPTEYDWPEWSTCANSIRAAEKLLKKRLAKTESWTLYPATPKDESCHDRSKRADKCATCRPALPEPMREEPDGELDSEPYLVSMTDQTKDEILRALDDIAANVEKIRNRVDGL